MKIATKDSWKTLPMSIAKRFDSELKLNPIEFKKIAIGCIPSSMEDKWFVYYDEGWLYIHRSWTGHLIFKANIQETSVKHYVIKEFWAEQDEERWKSNNPQEVVQSFKTHISSLRTRRVDNPVRNAILGLAVGDMLGVPVEFESRSALKETPVTDLRSFGTHNQPVGTWSDDTSLSLCLADELVRGYDLSRIGTSFVKWYNEGHWTPHGIVFDVGITTSNSIRRLSNGEQAELAGEFDEGSNGNGSLMRILPLLFHIESFKDRADKFKVIKDVSSITHAHIRSCLACYYLLEFASVASADHKFPLTDAYKIANQSFIGLVTDLQINRQEVEKFGRLLEGNIQTLDERDIYSSGYVIHSLEASIWCLLTTTSYRAAVLKAVNLGDDTDTTGSITGGIAGLYYGASSIPREWIDKVARLADIETLIKNLSNTYRIADC